ncbi:SnoaL-like protein [Gillisia sp. Hel_I_86]|uniref:nuclear transport factor 2 family protein n=1 Tax=Gillisia sp. Hel_I_86 TaxID=1249981 RepID=UPI00119B09F2|nr:nuclear transport factor 2 family protein [Gillisia sp. Hel_I_86]TVZ26855.1 SnoaL-like protein [Gillisia sp. Hel_I_86]
MKTTTRIFKQFMFLPLSLSLILGVYSCKEETKEVDAEAMQVEKEVVEVDLNEEKNEVEVHMKKYKDALQNLSTEGTMELFSEDSQVFESGGTEGTYKNYNEHHIGPELSHFNSFVFSDYNIDVQVDPPYAFTTETYIYTLDLKPNKEKNRKAQVINKKGVATSVLKKVEGSWKILKTHSSSRDYNPN